jgi:uncharacterized protein
MVEDGGGAATHARWELTGNHYIAFPAIDPASGAVHSANVLHRGVRGRVDWAGAREPGAGEPLLRPAVRIDGADAPLEELRWEALDRWIPTFSGRAGGLRVRGTLCAPGGHDPGLRGACYRIVVENDGRLHREIEIALHGCWSWSLLGIASTRPLGGARRMVRDRAAGVALEAGDPHPVAALAVLAGNGGVATLGLAGDGDGDAAAAATDDDGPAERSAVNGTALRFRVARSARVAPGSRLSAAFYIAVAPEADGALAAAAHLRRLGAEELLRRARLELARLARTAPDPLLAARLNRNLLFAYHFGLGRGIDDDRIYPVASRSPLFPGGAVYHERDALLWLLPALTLADPPLAREVLLRCFEQYSHRPGEASHYIDGGVLAPGFALDQCCAYGIALERYVREAQDPGVLDEPIVQDVLRELDEGLLHRLHPEAMLAASEIIEEGQAPEHPFVTVHNVHFWAFCRALADLWRPEDDEDQPGFAGAAPEIADAIWRRCTAEVDGLRVLVWTTDLEGEAAVHDGPGASLQLLPFLGFCDREDPLWRNTMELLRSDANPFWVGDAPFPGLAGRLHPGLPALSALCADLLGQRRDEALALLRRLPLDDGLACLAYDPGSGAAAVGRHYAAAAGFLAWALAESL